MSKAILITGCSTGIGHVTAHALHKRGYHVIASCRKLADVERLQQEGLTCIHLDLNCSKSISLAVQRTLELTGGKLYALFNNGAYGQPGALEDLPVDGLRAQFETNFSAGINWCVKYCPPCVNRAKAELYRIAPCWVLPR